MRQDCPSNLSNQPIVSKNVNFTKILNLILIFIPLGVIANIAFTFYMSDKNILNMLSSFSYGFFILAVILALVPWLTNSLRLLIWVNFLDKRLKLVDIFRITFATDLSAAVSPTAIGGAPVKLGMLMQKGISAGASISITLLPTIEDFFCLILIFPLTVYLTYNELAAPYIKSHNIVHIVSFKLIYEVFIVLIFAGFLVFALISLNRRLSRYKPSFLKHNFFEKIKERVVNTIKEFYYVYSHLGRAGKSRLAFTVALTIIQQISKFSVATALIASLGLCFVIVSHRAPPPP
ncbi:Lysylphosphatidylglycerol synthetase [Candidatus Magnetoovum chiemensis]|nr:Lysylphosphatidylglycerol synthetase [Candidatus Magnetoovum chiemensis]